MSGSRDAFMALWQPMLFPAVLAVVIWSFFSTHDVPGVFGFDFRGTLWEAAQALRSGVSPYPAVDSAAVAAGNPALYPPFAIALVIPLTWLPWTAAVALWATLLVCGAATGIYLLGVRDWRCYCVFFASLPALLGILWGNLTLLLLLGVGAAWYWRDRAAYVGAAVGALIAARLFFWPLLFWLILTRRWQAACWAIGLALAFVMIPWALIGFDGLRTYPALLNQATDLYGPQTSSLLGAGVGAGLSVSVAKVLPGLGAILLLCLACVAARRPPGDERVFAITLLACIVASPIVWNYYLAFIVAPVAVLRPRLSWLWLTLPATYLVDRLSSGIDLTAEPPPGVFYPSWATLHSEPPLGPALGVAALVLITVVMATFIRPCTEIDSEPTGRPPDTSNDPHPRRTSTTS